MNIRILAVSHDSGLRYVRMGRGPEHLLERGLLARLWDGGHDGALEGSAIGLVSADAASVG
jgi:hypothetical protein